MRGHVYIDKLAYNMGPLRTNNLDKVLLILEVLVEFHEKFLTTLIKRAMLRNLAEEKLVQVTNKQLTNFGGGGFESLLTRLERMRAIARERKSRKDTIFHIDMRRVKNLIIDKKKGQMGLDSVFELEEQQLPDSALEGIVGSMVVSVLDGKSDELNLDRAQHGFMKYLVKDIAMAVERHLYEYYFAAKSARRHIDDDTMQGFIRLSHVIAEQDPAKPFRLVIEYLGRPKGKDLDITHGPLGRQLISKFFVHWARLFRGLEVNDEDKKHILDGNSNLLSIQKMRLLNEFYGIVVKYAEAFRSGTRSKNRYF